MPRLVIPDEWSDPISLNQPVRHPAKEGIEDPLVRPDRWPYNAIMKKSLLGSACSKSALSAAINPVDPSAAARHREAKAEAHGHGPKPDATDAYSEKGHKPKNAGIANPANAFRGASRGS